MQSAKLAKLLLDKAEQDRYVIGCLLDDPRAPDEVIGFHAQQAVEKSIKAVLASRAVVFRRTHQLEELLALLNRAGIPYPPELSEAVTLTAYAVDLRYDMLPVHDDGAAPFDRQWANRCVGRIAEWALSVIQPEDG